MPLHYNLWNIMFFHCFYFIGEIVKCPLDVQKYSYNVVILHCATLQFCDCARYCNVCRFALLKSILLFMHWFYQCILIL